MGKAPRQHNSREDRLFSDYPDLQPYVPRVATDRTTTPIYSWSKTIPVCLYTHLPTGIGVVLNGSSHLWKLLEVVLQLFRLIRLAFEVLLEGHVPEFGVVCCH